MGTTLTGTKPKDTYDALIKVGDNGPIGATAKILSDGLGNDLPIFVSTTQVSIGGTENAKFYVTDANTQLILGFGGASTNYYDGNTQIFRQRAGTEIARFSASGLTFNGDTAAANALDDYEEGTFTPVFTTTGTPFVQGSSGTGKYTKIGNSVTITFNVSVGGVVSGGTGNVIVTGLPFTNSTTEAFGIFSAGRITLSADEYYCVVNTSASTLSIQFLNSAAVSTTLPASDVNGNTTPFFSTSITYLV